VLHFERFLADDFLIFFSALKIFCGHILLPISAVLRQKPLIYRSHALFYKGNNFTGAKALGPFPALSNIAAGVPKLAPFL
jgi:hypothetical protein